jgi:regulatory protein
VARMTAAGGRDAIIIPFPMQRVRETPEELVVDEEAVVHELEVPEVPEVTPTVIKRAHNVSLHALSGKSHSVAEMREKLRSRDLPDDAIESEIAELMRVGLLDDDALAQDLAERYGVRDRLARRAVEQKLRMRKIPAFVIEVALAGIESDEEAGLAEEAARERLRKMGSLTPAVARRRLYSHLQRKGFSPGDIGDAVQKVLG